MCRTIDIGSCIQWVLDFGIKIRYDNRLRAYSDYHSVLKNGSHDQLEQDMEDVEQKDIAISIVNWWDTSVYKTKIEVIGWSFHIEHIVNPPNRDVQSVIANLPVARSGIEVHQVWWRAQVLVTTPQFLPKPGAHWKSKIRQVEQFMKTLGLTSSIRRVQS
jgi:hypothetical protein